MSRAAQRSQTSRASSRKARSASDWRSEAPFLIAYGAMTAGTAIAALDSTAIMTRAGGASNGAIYTSLYLGILLLSLALVVPYAPLLAERIGMRRTFVLSIVLGSVLWLLAGALIRSGANSVPVLLISAVGFGVCAGVSAVLSPLYAKAYIGGQDMAGAFARLSVAGGLAFGIGSIVGGFILDNIKPGWGLVARAILGIPLALFVLLRSPAVEPAAPDARGGAWADMLSRVRSNSALRRAALLGCGVGMFAAPMASMIVPIAAALRQSPLISGAGILMAAMSAGELFSPIVVSRFGRRKSNLRAAAIASIWCAGFIAIYGCASLVFSHRIELWIWLIAGLGFGAMRYGGRALNLGAATDAGSDQDSGEMVATFVFVSSIAAPVGVLLWGFLINRVSVEAAVFAGALGTLLVSSLFLSRRAER